MLVIWVTPAQMATIGREATAQPRGLFGSARGFEFNLVSPCRQERHETGIFDCLGSIAVLAPSAIAQGIYRGFYLAGEVRQD